MYVAHVHYAFFVLDLQNVPPAVLVRFLREHRSEWADFNVDAYCASSLKAGSCAYPGMRPTRFTGSQIIMHLGHTIEQEEVRLCVCFLFRIILFWMNSSGLGVLLVTLVFSCFLDFVSAVLFPDVIIGIKKESDDFVIPVGRLISIIPFLYLDANYGLLSVAAT